LLPKTPKPQARSNNILMQKEEPVNCSSDFDRKI